MNSLDWRRVNDTAYHLYDVRADSDGVLVGMLEWWPAEPSRYGVWHGYVTTGVNVLGAIHLEQVYSSEQVCDVERAVEEAALARRVTP